MEVVGIVKSKDVNTIVVKAMVIVYDTVVAVAVSLKDVVPLVDNPGNV